MATSRSLVWSEIGGGALLLPTLGRIRHAGAAASGGDLRLRTRSPLMRGAMNGYKPNPRQSGNPRRLQSRSHLPTIEGPLSLATFGRIRCI